MGSARAWALPARWVVRDSPPREALVGEAEGHVTGRGRSISSSWRRPPLDLRICVHMSAQKKGTSAAFTWWALAPIFLTSCEGSFSSLAPAGRDASEIADLFWWMVGGGLLVWGLVMGLALYAIVREGEHHARQARYFIIGGGTVLPFILLSILLVFGLGKVPGLLAAGPEDGVKIRVVGEQWWWRVVYQLPDGRSFELANELWLPVNQRTNLQLETADVIHSFWAPSLAGKMDMIPGRTNELAIEPMKVGEYGGNCTEYCGLSHANMMFRIVVASQGEFDAWVSRQSSPAEGLVRDAGESSFHELGCGACHTVRGTSAQGRLGPDLTHVGSRKTLGAGILPNETDAFYRWLMHVDTLKPGAHMPAFDMVSEQRVRRVAEYLETLQ